MMVLTRRTVMNDKLYWSLLIAIFVVGWGVGRMNPPPDIPQPEVREVFR